MIVLLDTEVFDLGKKESQVKIRSSAAEYLGAPRIVGVS